MVLVYDAPTMSVQPTSLRSQPFIWLLMLLYKQSRHKNARKLRNEQHDNMMIPRPLKTDLLEPSQSHDFPSLPAWGGRSMVSELSRKSLSAPPQFALLWCEKNNPNYRAALSLIAVSL